MVVELAGSSELPESLTSTRLYVSVLLVFTFRRIRLEVIFQESSMKAMS